MAIITLPKNPLILGIDLEGMNQDIDRGVNTKVDRVLEIGAVMWDWEAKQPVSLISELINETDRLAISEDVAELTGISDAMIARWGLKGVQIKSVLMNLGKMMELADYLMAHNGQSYDVPMLQALFDRFEVKMPKKLWIDTAYDIEFPSKIKNRSMMALEHAHGFINPFPHRAVTDAMSMLKIASLYPLDRMVELAHSPKVTIVAILQTPNWKDPEGVAYFNHVKNKVSKAKFKWNPDKKIWTKEIHQMLLDEGRVNFDFEWKYLNHK